MRLLTRFFLVLILLAGGILIAGTAFLQFADLTAYNESIEKVVSRAIGRKVEINGSIKVNIFPSPEIILNEVSLANANWSTEPIMAKMGHLNASIGFLSVFSDMIIVKHIGLNDVSILLEQNDQQTGNWVMGKANDAKDAQSEALRVEEDADMETDDTGVRVDLPVMVELADLRNITVTMRTPGFTDQVYHIDALGLQPDKSGDIIVESTGVLLGNKMSLKGKITSLESVYDLGAVTLELKTALGDADVTGNLTTSRLETLTDLKSDIHVTVKDIQKALGKVGIQIPISGPFKADINVVGTEKGMDVAIKADLDGIHAKADATIIDVHLQDANLKLQVKDIARILKAAEIDVPLTGPLSADAKVHVKENTYHVDVESKVEGITTTAKGSMNGNNWALNAKVLPLKRLGELFDLKGITSDALELSTKITMENANDITIQQLQATVGKNSLSAQGRINPEKKSNLSVTIKSPDLSTLSRSLPKINFDAEADTQYSKKKVVVSDLAVVFDKSDLKGDFSMVKGGKNDIIANLTSKILDLRPFTQSAEPDHGTTEGLPDNTPTEMDGQPEPVSGSPYVFTKTPLPLEAVQKIEADVKIELGHFYYGDVKITDVAIDAAIHDGNANTKIRFTSANKGHAAIQLDLTTQGNQAVIDTLISLSDFRLNVLDTEDGISKSEVPPISVSVELKTKGASPRELASVANGRVLVTQGPGKISTGLLERFSGDIIGQLVGALNPFVKKEPFTQWECTVISIDIVDGFADIKGLLAQGEKVLILGGGDIDLKTERLNIEFNTKPRSGIGITADMFVTPFIKIIGTLAKPRMGLNKKGTLLTGGAAVATAGLSVLVTTALNRATAEKDHCEKILEVAGEHIQPPF